MKKLLLKPRFPVCQLDGFPKDCERSREGAFYLTPKTVFRMTDGEYEHFKKTYASFLKHSQVLPEPKKARPKPSQPPAAKKPEPQPPKKSEPKKVELKVDKKEEPKDSSPKKEEAKSEKK